MTFSVSVSSMRGFNPCFDGSVARANGHMHRTARNILFQSLF